MSVRIGHARISEHGTVNGAGGDQTGSEVCISRWYKGGWKFMLRPNTETLAEKSAAFCEKICANENVGYGQLQKPTRNTLHAEVLKVGYDHPEAITTPCNCDCSSFMQECAEAGGANIVRYSGNAQTTATMERDFPNSGLYTRHYERDYLDTDKHLKRGDILVSSGHTVMILDDGEDEENMTVEKFEELFRQYRKKLQDNDAGQWSAEAREWAIRNGILTGSGTLPDGTPNFMFEDLMTREQMVTVLYRVLRSVGLIK